MKLSGRTALITGGSRGLGAALGRRLARAGARIVLVARGREALDDVVASIRDGGGEAHAVVGDVGDKHAIHRIVGAAQAIVGPIDLLVHAASTLGPTPLRSLLDTECEDLADVLEVNLVGPFRLTKALAAPMALRGDGLVIGISSDAAVEAYPTWGGYGVSKAALDHLMAVFGAELGPRGVRFLAIDPGEMDTKMHADAVPDADRATLLSPDVVADRIAAIVETGAGAGGARIVAADFAAPQASVGRVAPRAETP